jgi:phage baseplate assembly protein W
MNATYHRIRFPFAIDIGMGTLAEEKDYAAYVEELIEQVLLTSPGERVNRPDFGCGLRQMVFAPNSDITASLTQVSVLQALDTWLGNLIVVNDVNVQAEEEKLEVQVTYTLKASGESRYLNVEVTL